MNIEGCAALVTGGASGLGAATATMLARNGARVTILDLNEELGAATAASIGATFIKTDVADEAGAAAAVVAAEDVNGPARILVNCAGIGLAQKTVGRESVAHSLSAFRTVINVNLLGHFNMIAQMAARLTLADKIGEERGVIVNTASVAAYDGQIGQAAYAASKGGIVGMTLPIARDLSQFGIRVVTIAPGLFLTPLLAALPAAAQESLGHQVPFPSRLGHPDEYAQMVESIVRNPMLNGDTIRLDGALRMAPR
jgi:NAD(P)-dependent dehydrogenase (short-subunit alcohol dehydrogenase family)